MDYFTPEQAADKLQVAYRTILKLIKEGKLPATKIGAHYRISQEQLDRFMRSQEVKPKNE